MPHYLIAALKAAKGLSAGRKHDLPVRRAKYKCGRPGNIFRLGGWL